MALPGFRKYASMYDRFPYIRNCVSVVGNEFPQTIKRAFHLRYGSLTNGHFIYVTAHLHRIWPSCTFSE